MQLLALREMPLVKQRKRNHPSLDVLNDLRFLAQVFLTKDAAPILKLCASPRATCSTRASIPKSLWQTSRRPTFSDDLYKKSTLFTKIHLSPSLPLAFGPENTGWFLTFIEELLVEMNLDLLVFRWNW